SGGFPDGSAGSRAPEGRAGRVGAKREGLEVAAAPGLREHLDADEAVEAAVPQGRAEAVELEGALAGEDAAVDRLLPQILALERRVVVELHVGEAVHGQRLELAPAVGGGGGGPGVGQPARGAGRA